MLTYILITIVFFIAVLFFCRTLLTHLYDAVGKISDKELQKLRFKNKAAFVIVRFWRQISEKKSPKEEQTTEDAKTIDIQEYRDKNQ